MQDEIPKRRNKVFKSLHRPMTYMGIERTLFVMIGVAGVATFNLFSSILAAVVIVIAGAIFGHWVTQTDPAYLRILGRSSKYKLRYDAAKQMVPRVTIR